MPVHSAPMPIDAVSKAIRVLCEGHEAEDSELIERLVNDGIHRRYATRLVLFIPVAYARVGLRSLGAKFSEYFRRSYGQGRMSPEQRLDSDEVWVEAQCFVEANFGCLSSEERRWIAGRSPELGVINQALNNGQNIKNQVLSPLVVWWPEA